MERAFIIIINDFFCLFVGWLLLLIVWLNGWLYIAMCACILHGMRECVAKQ